MKTTLRLLSLTLFALAAFTSARAAGAEGKWAAEFETPMGQVKCVYTFQAAGDTLTGRIVADFGGQKRDVPLQDLKLVGDVLTFFETVEMDGNAFRIDYTGDVSKAAAGEIAFARKIGDFGNDNVIAHRLKDDAPPAVAPVAPAVAAPVAAAPAPAAAALAPHAIAPGPFQPTWESLQQHYRTPEWFRDAKFGIWAHWSAQCVPEFGDWYARHLYVQGFKDYDFHVANYGHPSKFGFMELDNLWKAEKWDPEKLMDLYVRAGAKYFVALANHHDNFDAYDSKHHAWNSVNVGPKKDIVGTWAKVARAHGLRFGVSNHSAHAWHWFQTAYGYDAEGPLAGVRYDAATLKKEDGKGKWWEGLDPQELYTGPTMVIPDGLKTIKEAQEWHEKNDRQWNEQPPAMNPGFTEKWFLRCQDLVDKYHPDLLYFDNFALPLGQTGLDIAAHYYNASRAWHGGRPEAVLNIKGVSPERRGAVIDDIERGVAEGIRPAPWQTDTCIGSWHYDRRVFTEHKYKTVGQVARMLVDIVSKNGNLLLSVPVRGDGTLDEDEVAFLEGMAKWIAVNGEAIYGTRPWVVYGEGPSVVEKAEAGHFGGARDVRSKPYTAEDLRFTTKSFDSAQGGGGALYAFVMEWPGAKTVAIKSLATTAPASGWRKVTDVTLLGHAGKLTWAQDETGLHVQLPVTAPCEHAVALKITGIVHP